ncbi:MAG: ABC-F family ATP-binding cassette domain-containing protein [Spirochaetaceae bacterium]|jgi:ATP-binding cassette subfamily F protein 3|nr:ABC-F family ATP-binding cassette domain-containing protein [Spirochaetaceae bacterium]
MGFIQVTKTSLAFGDRDILKDINIHLAAGSKAALTGANGSGKSTLMKIIAGKLSADSGERALQKSSRVSYLPQSGIIHQGRTLREEVETAYAPAFSMLAEMENLGRALENAVRDDGKTAALLEEHQRLQEEVENSGYYERDQHISMVLTGLGFSLSGLHRQVDEFSGGWQMRIALAKVLLERSDILLLDEPTNYLDIEARSWLEGWLRDFSGGYLMVSHDRYFLDMTVTEVYELFQGTLTRYAGNYTAYEEIRRIELESLMARYKAQQEEIAKTEALIRRFRYKASKAAFAQELIKRLEKMERIEIPESFKKISIAFPPPPHAGRIALTVEGLGKSYGSLRVLRGLDLILESGEKLAAVGPNGAGKTTLLRILAGEDVNFEGRLQYGAGITAGYFSQDAAEAMTGSQRVLEFMEAEAPTALIPKVRDMLGSFLFRGDDVYKSISVLSGGEKSRLALLKMLLKPMNLLILDEPTNHLDLYSKDILLDTLKKFTGTIIFVSHDRAFMEALSTKTLEISPGGSGVPRLFYGNYAYYQDRLAREARGELPGEGNSPAGSAGDQASGRRETPASGVRETQAPAAAEQRETIGGNPRVILIKAAAEQREAAKQRQTRLRRLEREEAEILKHLAELEAEKARLEAELARPEIYSNGEKARKVQAKLREAAVGIETKTREWEEKAREAEICKRE